MAHSDRKILSINVFLRSSMLFFSFYFLVAILIPANYLLLVLANEKTGTATNVPHYSSSSFGANDNSRVDHPGHYYAKEQQPQQQISSKYSSVPVVIQQRIKNTGSFSNLNQLKFDYSAASPSSPSSLSSSSSSINPNANINFNGNLHRIETNPHLDVGLIDVEPEAALFLDETYFQTTTSHTPLAPSTTKLSPSLSSSSSSSAKVDNKNRTNIPNNNNNIGKQSEKYVDIRHFALTDSASSVTLRAIYGPFSARKSINPFSVVRLNDSKISSNDATTMMMEERIKSSSKLTKIMGNNQQKKENDLKTTTGTENISEQINAYLVTKEVRRSHPVLRVLFYASHLFELRYSNARPFGFNDRNEKSICAVVIVQFHGERLFGTCSPSQNKMNACLAEIVIPALYWPPLDVTNGGVYAAKQQKSSIAKVFYTINHMAHDQQCNDQNFLTLLASSAPNGEDGAAVSDLFRTENSMNLIHLSDVFLVPFRGSYEEVTNDNVVTVLIPQEPVYPNSKIYIPVKYTYNPEFPVSAFSLRVQVKPGLRILGAQLSHPNKLWQLSIELGPGQTTAIVTAFLRDYDPNLPGDAQSIPEELLENVSQEVYSWLIEVTEDVNINEMNGRIVWQLLYETDTDSFKGRVDLNPQQNLQYTRQDGHFEKESVKLTSLIDIQKDVMQEIIAITNSKELLNTAILNGKQVSRTMRIYQVSAAGHINDITFQCSCQSVDESILKVSTSCTSIYLDGSEIRGSQNATILIRYGSFIGQGNFIVWMPLMPLDVRVSDSKLSQLKGWRVHRHSPRITSVINQNYFGGPSIGSASSSIHDSFIVDEEMMADQKNVYRNADEYWPESFISNPLTPPTCQLKFQQARVEVYTRYLSSDHDSGREASLINRRHSIRITQIVQNLIRVSDKRVLSVRGNIIEGVGVGRADVEIISPITGAVIGSKEVEVTIDRESITQMHVRLVSGIKMDIYPYGSPHHNIWTVKTQLMETLTKQYQEALLDARLFFTDQTSVYLSEIPPTDYHLTIQTFKGVVDNVTRNNFEFSGGYPETISASYIHDIPRIIALMPGQGELIHVTLDTIHGCQKKKSQPLASTYVNVDVQFELPEAKFAVQNDAIHYRRYGNSRHHSINQTTFNEFINPLISHKKRIHSKTSHTYPGSSDENIKFQRHSIQSSDDDDPSDVSSIQFGILSLITIVCIACIIVVIYSVIATHLRSKNSQPPVITTTINSSSNNNGNNTATKNRVLNDFKPFLSCLNLKGKTNTSVSAVRDWVWISKEELENEQKKMNNKRTTTMEANERHGKLLTPLLPPKDYLENDDNNDNNNNNGKLSDCRNKSSSDDMRITINPSETLNERFIIGNQCYAKEQHCFSPRKNIDSKNNKRKSNAFPGLVSNQSHKSELPAIEFIAPTKINKTRHLPVPITTRNNHHHHRKHNSLNHSWDNSNNNHSIRNNINNNNINVKYSASKTRKQSCTNMDIDDEMVPKNVTPPPIPLHRNLPKSNNNIKINSSDNNDSSQPSQIPPPIPPHRNKKNLNDENQVLSSSSSSSSSSMLTNQPHHHPNRPTELLILNKNSDFLNNKDDNQQQQREDWLEQQTRRIDYRILNRLKESQT